METIIKIEKPQSDVSMIEEYLSGSEPAYLDRKRDLTHKERYENYLTRMRTANEEWRDSLRKLIEDWGAIKKQQQEKEKNIRHIARQDKKSQANPYRAPDEKEVMLGSVEVYCTECKKRRHVDMLFSECIQRQRDFFGERTAIYCLFCGHRFIAEDFQRLVKRHHKQNKEK